MTQNQHENSFEFSAIKEFVKLALRAGDHLLKFSKNLISEILEVLNQSVKLTKEKISDSGLNNKNSDSLDNLINGQLSSQNTKNS